jgi:hypothetical protein
LRLLSVGGQVAVDTAAVKACKLVADEVVSFARLMMTATAGLIANAFLR